MNEKPILQKIIFKSRGKLEFTFGHNNGTTSQFLITPAMPDENGKEDLRQHLLATFLGSPQFSTLHEAEQSIRRAIIEYKKAQHLDLAPRESSRIDTGKYVKFLACGVVRPGRGNCKLSMPVIIDNKKRSLIVSTGQNEVDEDTERLLKAYITERAPNIQVTTFEEARKRIEDLVFAFIPRLEKPVHRKAGPKIEGLPETSEIQTGSGPLKLVGPYIMQDKVMGCKFLAVQGDKTHHFIFSFYRTLNLPTKDVISSPVIRQLAADRIEQVRQALLEGLVKISASHPAAFVTERNPSGAGKRILDDNERAAFEKLQTSLPNFAKVTAKSAAIDIAS